MNWDVVLNNATVFVDGTIMTIKLAAAVLTLSVLLALPLAVMRDARSPVLRWFAAIYSWTTRAIPSLALLFLVYYGLPNFGISFDPIPAAILGLTISAAGYNMEYIRAGLRAVPQLSTKQRARSVFRLRLRFGGSSCRRRCAS